jgi:hypothetical protein
MERLILRSSKGNKVTTGDRVFVRYEGELLNGTVFDRNFIFSGLQVEEGRDLFSFVVGQGQVIQGWEQGLNNSRLGEVVQLVIPPELAYGANARPGIPPNSTLDFTIEIVGFSKGDRTTPVAYTLKDIGVEIAKYGLTEKDLSRLSASKIGLDRDESIVGTSERDFITGLGGNNQISGSLAGDILLSTKGSDIFRYTQPEDSQPGRTSRDFIGGFTNNDKIDLSSLSSELELSFIGKSRFSRSPGEIRYQAGLLSVDLTGDGSPDFEIEIAGKPGLGLSNLIL